MKERPILMSAPMVRAILAGQKTQTRRVMKVQPPEYIKHTVSPQEKRGEPKKHPAPYFDAYNHGPFWCWWDEYDRQGDGWIRCPYGQPGDRLWVRETHAYISPDEDVRPWEECNIEYKADTGNPYPGDWPADQAKGYDFAPKWRPSIHMRRTASRILLEVVSVRVERLQDISEEDCVAEGIEGRSNGDMMEGDYQEFWHNYVKPTVMMKDEDDEDIEVDNYFDKPSESYRSLWESINGPGSWDLNPYVWVVEFKVVSK